MITWPGHRCFHDISIFIYLVQICHLSDDILSFTVPNIYSTKNLQYQKFNCIFKDGLLKELLLSIILYWDFAILIQGWGNYTMT